MLLICFSSLACHCQGLKDSFDVRITPGIDFAHLTIANSPVFKNRNLRFGGEIEFLLPFNKKRWGLVAEPAYQSFHRPDLDYNYESIEASLGLRRHFHINDNIFIFVNAMSLVDIPIRHTQVYSIGTYGRILLTDNSLTAGLSLGGGVAMRRISVEGRYYTQRTRQADQLPLQYRYGKASIIFGFRLF